ncbi:MAG: type II methionyl aminopeptidase [Thaumarchaeota archaeon]|nr:type II methionyl aminopeptidase [Nitrososphaerota archaeon]
MKIPEQYRKSGEITKAVRNTVVGTVRPGMGFVEVCELVESEIRRRGGLPAFPTGIGVNQVTAHYAPEEGDASKLGASDVIKVDFGVHVEGYVTDTATTLTFDEGHALLLDVAKKCLQVAIEAAGRDLRVGEIGRSVGQEASRFGFRTIQNLTGHTVDRYAVHAGKSIPNLYVPGLPSLRTGDVFAIEPFVTPSSAAGYVVDSPMTTIFAVASRKKTGKKELDGFVDEVWGERKTLPFTPRWYSERWGRGKVGPMLKELVKRKVVHGYPTLVEASGRPVAQFEHTLALEDGGIVVLT